MKIGLRSMLARHNREASYWVPFGPRRLVCFRDQPFGGIDDQVRDALPAQLEYYKREIEAIDERLIALSHEFPQVEALLDIHGVGLYSALVVIGELDEVDRFRLARQVGAYAELTSKVLQSGNHCYYDRITRHGSP